MVDLYQDFARAKILLISSYEELLKANIISEDQFEAILELLDKIDRTPKSEIIERLQDIFDCGRGEKNE